MTVSATPSKFILYQSNSQIITITSLYDNVGQAYLDSATITGTLQDPDGADIAECTDILFTYVAGSQGNYQAVFGDINFTPAVGTGYTLVIDGNQSTSTIHLELLVEIQARQS